MDDRDVLPRTAVTNVWRSLHLEYYWWAVDSAQACTDERNISTDINREAVEAVRYSYDAIEASAAEVFHLSSVGQLPRDKKPRQLAGNTKVEWGNSDLHEKLNQISREIEGSGFWQPTERFNLFADLKKARDALTHPRPAGVQIKERIDREEIRGPVRRWWGTVLTKKPIPKRGRLDSAKRRSVFSAVPAMLCRSDAERAVEIMLLHLVRLEDLGWGQATSEFGIIVEGKRMSARDLLATWQRSFAREWPS